MPTSLDANSPSGVPTFSILTAAYNSEATIGATVASVLAQDRADWELIIIDDGSSDNTVGVVERVAAGDPRVRVVSQTNTGPAQARNHAAALARSELLCTLDADDAYESNYLSSMYRMIERYPDRDLYSCNGHYLYPGDVRVPIWRGRRYMHEQEYKVEDMLFRNRVFVITVVRRSAFERVGGFPELYAEDYALWLRILVSGGRHIYNPDRIGIYRITPASRATARDKLERANLEALQMLAREYPETDPALMEAALRHQRGRLEVAEMERRIVEGDMRGARRVFWRNVRAMPTLTRRVLGTLTISVHPLLYAKVFLGRMGRRRGGAA